MRLTCIPAGTPGYGWTGSKNGTLLLDYALTGGIHRAKDRGGYRGVGQRSDFGLSL